MLLALFFCSGTTAKALPIRISSGGYVLEETDTYILVVNADDYRVMLYSELTNANTASFNRALVYFFASSSLQFIIWSDTYASEGTRLGDGEKAKYQKGKSTSTATETRVLSDVNKGPLAQTKNRYHEVQHGETLYRIAKKYGISVQELCRLNDINSNEIIQPVQKLLVSSEKNQ